MRNLFSCIVLFISILVSSQKNANLDWSKTESNVPFLTANDVMSNTQSADSSSNLEFNINRAAEASYSNADYTKAIQLADQSLNARKQSYPYYIKSISYQALNEPDLALKNINQALKIDDLIIYNNQKGVLLYQQKRYKESIIYFEKALHPDKENNVDLYLILGTLYAMHTSDTVASNNYLNEYIQYCPRTKEQLFTIANVKAILGDYPGAIEALILLNSLEPENAEVWAVLAEYQYLNSDYLAAYKNISSSVALNESNGIYELPKYELLAKIQLQNSDTVAAEQTYTAIIKEFPNAKDTTYILRADFYFDIAEYEKAILDYENAKSINPTAEVHFCIAESYFSLNKFADALTFYDKAILIDKRNAQYYSNRAICKQELDDNKAAELDFNMAIKLDPANAWLYVLRAGNSCVLKDNKASIKDLNKAIILDSNNAEIYFERSAHRFFDFKDSIGAIADIKDAIRLDPKNSMYYAYLSCYYVDYYKDSIKGKEYLLKSIELDSLNFTAYHDLIVLCLKTNQLYEAKIHIGKYLTLSLHDEFRYSRLSNCYLEAYDYSKAIEYQLMYMKSHDDITEQLNLIELYYLNQQYELSYALSLSILYSKKPVSKFEELLNQYFLCITLITMEKDYAVELEKMTQLLKVYTHDDDNTWDFTDFDAWLKRSSLKNEMKIKLDQLNKMVLPKI